MDSETKQELRGVIEELHKSLTIWEKTKNIFSFMYFMSPFGYLFHYKTFQAYKEAIAIVGEVME